jgi:hypothetical protein
MLSNTNSVFSKSGFVDWMQKFQRQWFRWMHACYPVEHINDPKENRQRFAEEAIEAMQAFDMPKEEVLAMVEYVYGREKGEPAQEAAGALNCLVTLCNLHKINLGQAAVEDLDYCWQNLDKIRAKNALKPKFGKPPQPNNQE